jgi:hypothetical protein
MPQPPIAGSDGFVSLSLQPDCLRRRTNVAAAHDTTRYSHSEIRKPARSIRKNGFPAPAVLDDQGYVVAGWELVLAALYLGHEVPIEGLSAPVATERSPVGISSDSKGSVRWCLAMRYAARSHKFWRSKMMSKSTCRLRDGRDRFSRSRRRLRRGG